MATRVFPALLLGLEDWGVSNNVRHSLRRPTFDGAQVGVGSRDLKFEVKVAR